VNAKENLKGSDVGDRNALFKLAGDFEHDTKAPIKNSLRNSVASVIDSKKHPLTYALFVTTKKMT